MIVLYIYYLHTVILILFIIRMIVLVLSLYLCNIYFSMSMANLTFSSVNCRGLASDEIKRRGIFHKCK